MIRAVGLGYTFASGRTGLASVDLDIEAGELVALVGPNGSGKTTLLRLFAGDLVPTTGTLAFTPPIARSRIGWTPAEPIHFDELTGRENARFFARACGAVDDAVSSYLQQLDLGADADVAVAEYSFGMRRKLHLIEALAHDTALLLLDEPTIGLDPRAAGVLIEAVRARVRNGAIVMLGTHDVTTAMIATRVVFLHRGRKIADAAPAELLALVRESTRIEVSLATLPERAPEFPAGVVAATTATGFALEVSDAQLLPEICAALLHAGARIGSIQVREADLADLFNRLTGEPLVAAPGQAGE